MIHAPLFFRYNDSSVERLWNCCSSNSNWFSTIIVDVKSECFIQKLKVVTKCWKVKRATGKLKTYYIIIQVSGKYLKLCLTRPNVFNPTFQIIRVLLSFDAHKSVQLILNLAFFLCDIDFFVCLLKKNNIRLIIECKFVHVGNKHNYQNSLNRLSVSKENSTNLCGPMNPFIACFILDFFQRGRVRVPCQKLKVSWTFLCCRKRCLSKYQCMK